MKQIQSISDRLPAPSADLRAGKTQQAGIYRIKTMIELEKKKCRDVTLAIAGILAILSIVVYSTEVDNLIQNGGFETEDAHGLGFAENWPPRFARTWITLDDTISHTGRKSLKIAPSKRTGTIECCRQTVPVEAGKKYQISFWWKSEGVNLTYFIQHPEDTTPFNTYHFFDAKGKSLAKEYRLGDRSSLEGTHNWMKFETVLTAPPRAEKLRIGLGIYMATGVLWYDDVSVVLFP